MDKSTIGFVNVLHREARLFFNYPLLAGSILLIALVPAIYTALYVGSIWDPYGHLSRLPVGLVIEDKGTEFKDEQYNLGQKLRKQLLKKEIFSFISYENETAAKEAVKKGDAFFALVVPENFSERAVPGTKTAELKLYSSEGANAISAIIAAKFSQKIAANVNEQLELARWKSVLGMEERLKKGLNVVTALPKAVLGAKELIERKVIEAENDDLTAGAENIHHELAQFGTEDLKAKMTAETMARSVKLKQVEVAPVVSNGAGFLPYFMGFSLWIGAISASFLLRLRVYSVDLKPVKSWAKIAGKWMIPTLITVLAGVVLAYAVETFMKVKYADALGVYAILICAAVTYASIILALNVLLGEAGKIFSVLLLALQLSTAAGVYPIVLSGDFFRHLSPWLPLTHVVGALRSALFGASDANWLPWLVPLIFWTLGCHVVSMGCKRFFKYLPDADYTPALDLPRRK